MAAYSKKMPRGAGRAQEDK